MAEGNTLGDTLSATVVLCQGVYSCLQCSEWRTVDYAASEGAATWCCFGTCDVDPGCPTLPGFQEEVLPFCVVLRGVVFCPQYSQFVQLSGPSLEEKRAPRSPRAAASTVPWAATSLLSLPGLPRFLPCHHTENEDNWPCRFSPISTSTSRQLNSLYLSSLVQRPSQMTLYTSCYFAIKNHTHIHRDFNETFVIRFYYLNKCCCQLIIPRVTIMKYSNNWILIKKFT